MIAPQAKAREIYTTGAINEFKEYYRLNGDVVGSPLLHRKIMDALEIRGAAAWFVHYAVKRNYDKWNRGKGSFQSIASPEILIVQDTKNSTVEERVNAYTANKVGTSTKADTRTRRVMWDPVRDL